MRLTEHQSRRLIELDTIHHDLEKRLEAEHVERQRLELTLQRKEVGWKRQSETLHKEKVDAERLVKEEKVKVDKLMEMVNRLQTEIHTLIKNKFSHGGNAGGTGYGGHHPLNQQQHQQQQHHGLTSSHSYGGGNLKRVASGQAAASSASSSTTMGNTMTDKQHRSTSTTNNNNNNSNRRDYSNGSHNSAATTSSSSGRHIGPHEILVHHGSAEAVRERNAFGSLLDFFGM
mmetsp:Transcript_24628/g.40368  ORF Transcript_24628/g.40368 Transcript_24628/m.40368 type:complete len:230 (+) Transcript_24628:687-1376(+)